MQQLSARGPTARMGAHLFPAVEDGAVPAGAQHVLQHAALAALALGPQLGVRVLQAGLAAL